MNARCLWMIALGTVSWGCGTAQEKPQYAVSPEQVTLSVYEAAFNKDFETVKQHLTDDLLSSEQNKMAQVWGKRLEGIKAPYEFSIKDEKRKHQGTQTTVLMSTPKGTQEVQLQLVGTSWRISSTGLKSP